MEFNLNQYLIDLKHIVNIDSGTTNIEGNYKIAHFFQEKFEKEGFKTKLYSLGEEKRPLLSATYSPISSNNTYDFFMVGHIDTVFPDGTATVRPFTIEGDKAFGPGTIDMKSGALLIFYIAKFIKNRYPDISLSIALNSDEEIGSKDSKDTLIRLGSLCQRCLIFEGGRKKGQFVYERKGIAKFKIQVSGMAAHSGTAPKEGANAIVQLAHIVTRIDKLNNYEKGTSVNVGIINGGKALNIIPDNCEALVEVRYWEERQLNQILESFSIFEKYPYVDRTISHIDLISHYPPLLCNKTTVNFISQLRDFGSKNGYTIEFVRAGGVSDGNRLATLGIPIIDGCGPSGGFPHSDKEFLSIKTVEKRFKLITDMIKYVNLISKK